jgi:hypothetical protein
MLRPIRAVTLLVLLALPALATGCSVGKKLKTDQIETQISQQYKSQTGDAVASVSCPNDVDVKAGATFTCDLKLVNGKSGKITITQLDDKGHVRWQVNKVS